MCPSHSQTFRIDRWKKKISVQHPLMENDHNNQVWADFILFPSELKETFFCFKYISFSRQET